MLLELSDLTDAQFMMNIFTIFISLFAVYYWLNLFRKLTFKEKKESGWQWIYSAVIMIFLLNIGSIILVLGDGTVELGFIRPMKIDIATIGMLASFARTLIVIGITIGGYLLLDSIKGENKVMLTLKLKPVREKQSKEEQQFQLESGYSYMVSEEEKAINDGGHSKKPKSMEFFIDQITHGKEGLIITREYPQHIRDKFKIEKTPILWLTKEKTSESDIMTISPTDLVGLSFLIKDFIKKSTNPVLLIMGLEYLMIQNNFEEIIKLIQGIDDVAFSKNALVVIPINEKAFTERQLNLLRSELKEIT